MKVTLKRMTLTNFKGERKREINFSRETNIFGANGTGKSRIMNAFLWGLFGKDQRDRSNYEVRTRLADGSLLYKEECSVEIELSLDERTYVLKRKLTDEWICPRNEAQEVYKGDKTECWIDGTPKTPTEYQNFVEEYLKLSIFKILSQPLYFSTLDWRELREILFMSVTETTDKELAEGDEDFMILIEKLNGSTIATYRSGLQSAIKTKEKKIKENDTCIKQVLKMMPESKDWAEIEKKIKSLDVQINDLNEQITNKNERVNTLNKPYEDTLIEIANKETQCRIALETAQAKENAIYKKEDYQTKIDEVVKNITLINDRIKYKENNIKYNNEEISKIDKGRNILRTEFQKKQAEVFNGSNLCPTCNRPLESEQDFENAKTKTLKEINANNVSLKEKRNKLIANNEQENKDKETLLTDLTKLQEKQKELVDLLDRQSKQTPRVLSYDDVPECKILQVEIAKLKIENSTRIKVDDSEVINQLKQEVADKATERDNCLLSLKDRETIATFNAEIKALEQENKNIIAEKAQLERIDDVAIRFMEKKINNCEEKINSQFSLVKFQLYKHFKNGNVDECCTPTINGVPFNSVNTAMQINGGLDVINALSKFWDMSVPIFIDNRESVNNLIPTTAQIINLMVTEDKELVIK